jgi:hypothetical protein
MADWKSIENASLTDPQEPREPEVPSILLALAIAIAFVFVTRWPVARIGPMEPDECGYLNLIKLYWFPMQHTLFLASGRLLGDLAGDPYGGLVRLDMLCSALALVSVWWWLRALVRPAVALGATLLLGVGPVFWGYGSVAGNYTAIVLVGALLLGIAVRGRSRPMGWHPFASAVVLALGTGYRTDIGVFWLPVLLVTLWQHRWRRAILAGILFAVLNLTWIGAMLYDVGGWARYRAATAEFAHEAGLLNSIWYLGLIDGPVRYAVKLGIGLVLTLGPALVFVPRGFSRLYRSEHGGFLSFLMGLSMMPALGFHLLIHYGVPGYSFHYLPALIALIALGIGRLREGEEADRSPRTTPPAPGGDRAVPRLVGIAAMMAALFWFYPANDSGPGWRGDLNLAFCRYTRSGLTLPISRVPTHWRTSNSRDLAGHSLSGSSSPARWE